MGSTSTSTINWKAIVSQIRKGKTILILGPDVYRTSDGAFLYQKLLDELAIETNQYIQKYYPEDNFFLFKIGGGRSFTCVKIENFLKAKTPEQTLQQLVKIPFQVMLTVTPDKLLPTAFQQETFNFQFDYYKKLCEPANIQQPSVANPLIYNLFGCVADEESMILTHNDLYDYFKSIFARKSIPDKLKQAILKKEINCFLFLGVPFDKWYMQLLLRELEIHRNKEDFIRYAANQQLTNEVKTFCTEQFTIQFVDQHIPEFVQTLYNHCEAEGILRKKGGETPWENLRELIANGKMEIAIEQFVQLAESLSINDEVIGLSSRYRRFARKKRSGVLAEADIGVQEAKIIENLLELIGEAEKM